MNLDIKKTNNHKYLSSIFTIVFFFLCTYHVNAAALEILPIDKISINDGTFTVKVILDTNSSVNAISGEIKFLNEDLSLVSISRDNSIVSLWIEEPTDVNENGSISFAGVILGGYTGKTGEIVSLVFKYKNTGEARIGLSNGSTLANDGYGTELYEENIYNDFKILSIDKMM